MPPSKADRMWTHEEINGSFTMGFRIVETLFVQQSPYQRVEILETADHGRILLNDGVLMLTERDEFIYHEMIAHVPLFVHPHARNVLVIGGGDGGTAREVLKHRSVERVVMVEIDEVVVEACREFLPGLSRALEDPRLKLIVGDGIRYAAETEERFDIVIVDSTDPVGPGAGLFGRSFYESAARILAPQGILVTQAESPFYDADTQAAMLTSLRPLFEHLHLYLYTTLSYPGGLYAFGFASRGPCPLKDFDSHRYKLSGISFRYYNADIHRAAFMLPSFMRERFGALLDPLEFADSG